MGMVTVGGQTVNAKEQIHQVAKTRDHRGRIYEE